MKQILSRVGAIALVAAAFAASGAPATPQSKQELIEKFIAECRPQFMRLKKQGVKIKPLIKKCVQSRFQAMQKKIRGSEWKLTEFTPWLTRSTGPEKAKGVIYFIRGWGVNPCCQTTDDFRMVPYFLKTLSEDGWDVIAAKVPYGPRAVWSWDAAEPAALYVKRRVGELRRQGYRQVVVGGHSWGSWVSLVAAQDGRLQADALLLTTPNTYGPKIFMAGKKKGQPNPRHALSSTNFRPLLNGIRIPTVMIVFRDDPYEPPGDRGEIAKGHFENAAVPHLIINKPAGFGGHSGAWLPVFDYAFGECIRAFLDRRVTERCQARTPSNDDFRSILLLAQFPFYERLIADAQSLAGEEFAVFTLDDTMRHYAYAKSHRINMNTIDRSRQSFVFHNGLHCVGRQCSVLMRWSDREIVEFDARSRKLRAWWVAMK